MRPPLIEKTRALLGPPPRRLLDDKMPPGRFPWLRAGHAAHPIWTNRVELARKGFVTMGVIVQANVMLWEPGPHDSAAQVLYAAAPWEEDVSEPLLEAIARECMGLRRATWRDPALARIGALLDAENTWTIGERIPDVLAFGANVRTGATLVPRSFLPLGYLSTGLLPLFVSKDVDYVLPVPWTVWDAELVQIARDAAALP